MIEQNARGGFTILAFPCNQFYLQVSPLSLPSHIRHCLTNLSSGPELERERERVAQQKQRLHELDVTNVKSILQRGGAVGDSGVIFSNGATHGDNCRGSDKKNGGTFETIGKVFVCRSPLRTTSFSMVSPT